MIEELRGLGLRPSRIGLEVLLDLCAEVGDLPSTLVILRQLGRPGDAAHCLHSLQVSAPTSACSMLACSG